MRFFSKPAIALLLLLGVPVAALWADGPSVTYEYDLNGNCIAITNELGQRSTYTYDGYRRCTSYTEPVNALDWKGSGTVASRTWSWYYDRYFGANGFAAASHTSKQWRVQIEPAYDSAGNGNLTARWFDYEDRILDEYTGLIAAANGAWSNGPDIEVHHFTYDENGNKNSYTDPRGRQTIYEYNLRNLVKKATEYPLAGETPGDPRVTETVYDTAGNKRLVTFPDLRTQQWSDYDAFGQAWTFIDERNNTTNLSYQWGPMKKLLSVTTYRTRDDGGTENQPTTFTNDGMGRLRQTSFPDGSHEDSTYEFGQLKTWKMRKGQTKTIVYDARGRELSHSWDDGVTPAVARAWDDANRLSAISNIFSSIDYGYDDAGQVIWEGDEIAGSGGRTQTNYYRYPDGSVAHLHYPGGVYLRKDYTARGQLAATGWDDDDSNWWMKLAAYTYLADGKVDHQDYGNGTTATFGYDDRGFTRSVQHQRAGSGDILASRTYTRDTRDRITSFQKGNNPSVNPMENARGDRFRYDDEGQLVEGWYNATDPANSGAGATRYDGFNYDALGNRTQNNYVASRGLTSFIRRDNALNQYSSWTPSIIYHDDNYPGWSAPGNGVTMAEGWITASYNALNQPIAVWSPAYSGTPNFMWFGYDPLGRCVKRWVSDSGDIYSNPATYFHYDGWNLLQEGANAWGPARVYAHGSRIDEIVWSYNTFTGDEAFYHYDARGHCILLTDSLGNILEQYEYDAFGQAYFYDAVGAATTMNGQPGSPFGNRFLFTGREWLSELHLYDFRNRLYQPELGRFLQPDPKEFGAGDYNLYRYCHNDPVNKSDPFGDTDLSYYGPADGELNEGATNLPDSRAVFTVAGHGNETGGLISTQSASRINISPHALAQNISKAGGDSAKSIKLYVCEAGKGTNSYAQKLANETGKAVTAPTKLIWIDKKGGFSIYDAKRDAHGNPIVGPNGMEKNLKEPGVMKTFYPEGKKLKKDE